MREQMPHRRAGRPGGLVEVDRPLLGGDERRQRGDRLRHRGPAEDERRRPTPRDLALRAQDGDGHVLGRPVVYLPERVHEAAILAPCDSPSSPGSTSASSAPAQIGAQKIIELPVHRRRGARRRLSDRRRARAHRARPPDCSDPARGLAQRADHGRLWLRRLRPARGVHQAHRRGAGRLPRPDVPRHRRHLAHRRSEPGRVRRLQHARQRFRRLAAGTRARLVSRVLATNAVSVPLDSIIFLAIAFGRSTSCAASSRPSTRRRCSSGCRSFSASGIWFREDERNIVAAQA